MGKLHKKGKAGAAINYITRNQALKKLQVTLADFRYGQQLTCKDSIFLSTHTTCTSSVYKSTRHSSLTLFGTRTRSYFSVKLISGLDTTIPLVILEAVDQVDCKGIWIQHEQDMVRSILYYFSLL